LISNAIAQLSIFPHYSFDLQPTHRQIGCRSSHVKFMICRGQLVRGFLLQHLLHLRGNGNAQLPLRFGREM
jgi:hypothetical protein